MSLYMVVLLIVLIAVMVFEAPAIFRAIVSVFASCLRKFRSSSLKSSSTSTPHVMPVNVLTSETESGLSELNDYHQNRNMSSTEGRILILEDGQHQQTTLFRLEKNWTLEFRVGPSLFGLKVTIFTNIPNPEKSFSRHSYEPLIWDNPLASDDTLSCRVKMIESGSFHYYFQCDGESKKRGSGYLVVDPVLRCGSQLVPLNSIQCVTYLSKNLGSFCSWHKKLQVAKESGYNMIHFTPIQELGKSQSAYSLSDQLKINSKFADTEHTEINMEKIAEFTEKLRTEWKKSVDPNIQTWVCETATTVLVKGFNIMLLSRNFYKASTTNLPSSAF